jgi:peptidoglycan/xylan/chitin deacetylase (PgdA/CDA1 family)
VNWHPVHCLTLALSISGLLWAQTPVAAPGPRPGILARTLYLTFDDGPLNGSEDIDDAIRADKVKINVMVVGHLALAVPRLKAYLQLYETNPWIEVGNHSFSHAHDDYRAYYADPGGVLQDFLRNEKALKITNRTARLPGRNMWRLKDRSRDDVKSGSTAADLLFKSGFRVFGWDLEWQHDPKTGAPVQTVEDMVQLVEQHLGRKRTLTEDHLVVLCHDEMFRKPWEETELKDLIGRLAAKGYKFAHLSEYP